MLSQHFHTLFTLTSPPRIQWGGPLILCILRVGAGGRQPPELNRLAPGEASPQTTKPWFAAPRLKNKHFQVMEPVSPQNGLVMKKVVTQGCVPYLHSVAEKQVHYQNMGPLKNVHL